MTEAAQKRPMEEEQIRKQMDRLGNTEFAWEKLDIQVKGPVFVPIKELNELRREAVQKLEQALIKPYKRKAYPPSSSFAEEMPLKTRVSSKRSLSPASRQSRRWPWENVRDPWYVSSL